MGSETSSIETEKGSQDKNLASNKTLTSHQSDEFREVIEKTVLLVDPSAKKFRPTRVVDYFPSLGSIYYVSYESTEQAEADSFNYLLALEDSEEYLIYDDGIELLKEMRRILDQKRSLKQLIYDNDIFELISFTMTILFAAAFVISVIAVFNGRAYSVETALTSMFLTILGFYFGREFGSGSGLKAKARIQADILASLSFVYPKVASIRFERVFSRFLGVSVYYIDYATTEVEEPTQNDEVSAGKKSSKNRDSSENQTNDTHASNGEENEEEEEDENFTYAVIEGEDIDLFESAEKVVLHLRASLARRQRLFHRFIQLGPFEVAAAFLALTLAISFSFITVYSLYSNTHSQPKELSNAMNLIIGYYFAKSQR